MDIHTFTVFMYYDDIMNFITLVCGYKIDSTAIPHRISPRNQGTARKMPRSGALVSIQGQENETVQTSRSVATSQFLPVLPQVSSAFEYPHSSATVCPELCVPVNSTSTLYRRVASSSGRET